MGCWGFVRRYDGFRGLGAGGLGREFGGIDGKEVAEGAQEAAGQGGGGEEFGDAGLGEGAGELAGEAGGLVGDGVDQPAAGAGEALGGFCGGFARFLGARRADFAGGEAGHEAGEALLGAVEVGAEAGDEEDVFGVFEQGVGDEGGEVAQDDGDGIRQARGQGLERLGEG